MYSQLKHIYSSSLQSSNGLRSFHNSSSYELFTYSLVIEPNSSGIIEAIAAGKPLKYSIAWDEAFFVYSVESEVPVLDTACIILLEDAGLFVSHAFHAKKGPAYIF